MLIDNDAEPNEALKNAAREFMTNKEACKEWALRYEEKTGKFPVYNDWIIKLHLDDPLPCGIDKLKQIFGSWNDFRVFCGKLMKNPSFNTLKEAFEYYLSHKIITEDGHWVTPLIKTNKSSGYAEIFNRKKYKLHIVSYLYHRDGDVNLDTYKNRDVEIVRHLCTSEVGENRACFNPEHLAPGDNRSNSIDALSYHASVKAYGKIYDILCEHDENIAAGSGTMDSYRALASKYDMSTSAIGTIVRVTSWKNDPGRLRYNAEKEAGQSS